jgi:hypothetical protein
MTFLKKLKTLLEIILHFCLILGGACLFYYIFKPMFSSTLGGYIILIFYFTWLSPFIFVVLVKGFREAFFNKSNKDREEGKPKS